MIDFSAIFSMRLQIQNHLFLPEIATQVLSVSSIHNILCTNSFYRRQKPPIRSCTNLEFLFSLRISLYFRILVWKYIHWFRKSHHHHKASDQLHSLPLSQKALRLCNSNHQWPGNISGKRAEHRRIQYNLLKQLRLPCSCNCANRPTHRMRKKN